MRWKKGYSGFPESLYFCSVYFSSRGAFSNGKAEIIPVEPDQGNACAGSRKTFSSVSTRHRPVLQSPTAYSPFIKLLKMKRNFTLVLLAAALNAPAQENDTTELLPVEVRAVRAGATAPFAKTNLGKAAIQR